MHAILTARSQSISNRKPSLAGSRGRRALAERQRCAAESAGRGHHYSLTLKKPLGITFVDKGTEGGVVVEEVAADGNAAKAGVKPGDVLKSCSAITLKAGKEGEFEREGYGKRPYDNWQKITFECTGESFDTVMDAIKSNNERWGFFTVDLVIWRPDVSKTSAAKAQ